MMKTALILGAASDVAKAFSKLLAADGWNLVLASRQPTDIDALAADLQIRCKGTAETVAFDAMDFASHAAFYDQLTVKPDMVCCAFGYLGDQHQGEKESEERRRILETNYNGAVNILEIVAADFEARRTGTIIGISSVAGERGRQSNYLYGSAKAGFTAYLSGLRNRLYPANVHVLTVLPGFMRTRMTDGMSLPPVVTASPEQAAAAIMKAFKKSKNSVYVLWMWRWIMCMVRNIPECVFKRLNT